MAYTDKQIRNGATGSDKERASQRGPIPNLRPLKSQAQKAGRENMTEGHALTGPTGGPVAT